MKNILMKAVCVLLALLTFAAMAIASDDDGEPSKVGEVSGTAAGASEQSGGQADTQVPQTTDKTEYRVGEKLVVDSTAITYLSSGEYVSDNMFIQPKEGNKYVYIRLYVENLGTSDISVSYFDFDGYADGYACDQTYSMDDALSASLSSGRTAVGTICIEVPANAAKIEFEYQVGLFDTKIFRFIYEGVKDSGITPEVKAVASADAFKVGDIVETGSDRISYLSCGEYQSDNMFITPADGFRFVYFEFEFENISSSDNMVTSIDFKCFADGAACASHSGLDGTISGTYSPGRKLKGKMFFEVPVNASVIEAEYEPNLFSSKKVIFAFSK